MKRLLNTGTANVASLQILQHLIILVLHGKFYRQRLARNLKMDNFIHTIKYKHIFIFQMSRVLMLKHSLCKL